MGSEVWLGIRPATLEGALEETQGLRRHLLLGNGFSRAFSNSFAYPSLYAVAGSFSPAVSALFEIHKPDFEAVLGAISRHRADASPAQLIELNRQESEVKSAFVRAVAGVHPESALSASHEQKEACAEFLRLFHPAEAPSDQRGKIFTTNYDLLLFWVVTAFSKHIKGYDGFIGEPGNTEFRPWDSDKVPDLVYLHGALHIFTHQRRLVMLRYREGARLIDQIRARLDADEFPLIVAEGSSQHKSRRIRANGYLAGSRGIFRGALNDPASVLFTYGHSLSHVDAHLLSGIGGRKLRAVYVGAFGGIASADGERAHGWAEEWARQRSAAGRPLLPVTVYDSSSFNPWLPL